MTSRSLSRTLPIAALLLVAHAALAMAAVAAVAAVAAPPAATPSGTAETRLHADAVDHADGVPLEQAANDAVRQRLIDEMVAFYRGRSELAWFEGGTPRPAARELLRSLRDSRDEGLVPEVYRPDELAALLDQADAGTLTEAARRTLDLRLTRTFLVFASHLASGRVDPTEIDSAWEIEPPRPPLGPVLEAAVARGRHQGGVRRALDTLRPPQPQYDLLTRGLARYRKLAAAGGWRPVPDGEVLEVGDEVPADRLDALVARLQATEELSRSYMPNQPNRPNRPDRSIPPEGIYDETLARAVATFQERRGLTVDGKVGPETLAALAVPVEERIETLVLNLERWRWLPRDLGRRHIQVNLASFELVGVEDGRPSLAMRVVVGRAGFATPVLQEMMEYVVINPYWNIPTSLAVREILPEAQKDPGYVVRKGYEVLAGWGDDAPRLDPYQVPWRSYSKANFPVRLRQPPGPGNTLGQIKFIFPNERNIYLHDTPAHHLFDRAERDFSHGCVRVEDPYALAHWVFEPTGKLTADDVRRKVRRGQREFVHLDEELPVYLLYWTAFADDEGVVHLRDDLYGHDRQLTTALEGRLPKGLRLGA